MYNIYIIHFCIYVNNVFNVQFKKNNMPSSKENFKGKDSIDSK